MTALTAVVTACAVHVSVGEVTPSPVSFSPARYGPGSAITGTGFRASVPAGYGNGEVAFAGDPNVEVALKKLPVTSPGPGIIVTLSEAPVGLPFAAYADIAFHKDLQDTSGGKVHLISGLHGVTVGGQAAEAYLARNSGYTDWTILAVSDNIDFDFELVAPSDQFAAARSGAYREFLASWHWE